MSHSNSKKYWESLSIKEKESIWLKNHGTRILPTSISGSELEEIEKEGFGKYFSSGPSLGGGIED